MTSHKNRTFCLKDDFKHDAAFWHVTSPTTFIRRHWHLLLWERKKLYLVGSIAHVDIDTFCCRDTRHPVLLSHIFQLLGTDRALSRHRDALLMTRFVPDFRFLQEPAGSPPTRALPQPLSRTTRHRPSWVSYSRAKMCHMCKRTCHKLWYVSMSMPVLLEAGFFWLVWWRCGHVGSGL